MDETDDRGLLRAYAERRDEAAFAALVARHGALVVGVGRRICGPDEADDIAQATFLVLAERAPAVAAHPAPAAWLHRTATQIALRARRAALARARREQEAAQMARAADPQTSNVVHELDAALATLPASYRGALVAHYLEGRAATTLAAELGVSGNALAMRLSRGRELLRAALARRGVAVAGAALLLALADAGQAGTAVPPGITTLPSATATALSQAHLRGLMQFKLLLSAAAVGALALVATVALALADRSTASPSAHSASTATPAPLPTTAAPTTQESTMAIEIIDQPFHRTLYGKAGTHVPGQPYGPDIIGLLNQVWPAVKSRGVTTTGINHLVYDGADRLFGGIEATSAVPADFELVARTIDLQRYAYYKYIGPYSGLPATWDAIEAEIARRGLVRGQPGVEIYGHMNPDESKSETEILIPVAER